MECNFNNNFVYSSKKVIVYGLDVNNKSKLKKILEKINLESDSNYFDIIIDDGSHYLGDILFSLKHLFKHVVTLLRSPHNRWRKSRLRVLNKAIPL